MATTVVAAIYGVLPEFDPDRNSVKSYTARAKVFFKANSIVEEKQAPIFLTCIGTRTYDLLESLLAPTTLDEATFETLVKTLEEHFQPKPNSISKRYAFSQRAQQPRPLPSIWQLFASLPLTVTLQVKNFSKRPCEIAWLVECAAPLSARSC